MSFFFSLGKRIRGPKGDREIQKHPIWPWGIRKKERTKMEKKKDRTIGQRRKRQWEMDERKRLKKHNKERKYKRKKIAKRKSPLYFSYSSVIDR